MDFEAHVKKAASAVSRHLGLSLMYHYQEGYTKRFCAVRDFNEYEVSLGVGIDTNTCAFAIEIAQLDREPKQGDLITHKNATYEVKHIQNDGIGIVRVACFEVDTRHKGDF